MNEKEDLHSIFFFANEAILLTDSKGVITMINPSAEKLFKYTNDELAGKAIEILIPSRYTASHQQKRNQFNKNPHPRKMGQGIKLLALKKDGSEFPVEVSLSPFENKNDKGVIAFVIDITERRAHEISIEKQKLELERLTLDLHAINAQLETRVRRRTLILEEAISELNKTKEELNAALAKEKELNDMKSRFVSMASHEFRTPLATILSSLSLVTKYGELNDLEKQTKHIARIKTSINNLTDILNDVLSISKLEEGKVIVNRAWINLKILLTEIVQQMQSIAKIGQLVNYDHSGNENIFIDARILRHSIINLISNSIKFSDEGQTIDINTKVDDENIIIVVVDHGIGIMDEEQNHVFERFFRAPNAANVQGTGLGLNIVAKYAESLGGKILFKSKLNEGSTFTLSLPNIKNV